MCEREISVFLTSDVNYFHCYYKCCVMSIILREDAQFMAVVCDVHFTVLLSCVMCIVFLFYSLFCLHSMGKGLDVF